MLGSRDIFPTLIAAGSGYITYLAALYRSMPFGLSDRLTIVVLLILGFATCVTSGLQNPDWKQPYSIVMGKLGGLALLFAVIGLVKPMPQTVMMVSVTIVLLWLITTVRHATQ